MKPLKWKNFAELIGSAAIVASLIFVGQQMRLDRTLAQADAWMQFVDSQVALSQLINDNAEVWLKGLEGEELSGVEQLKFNQIAFAYEQKNNSRFIRSRDGVREGSTDSVVIGLAHDLHHYPGLRKAVLERWDMSSQRLGERLQFHVEVEAYLARLDSGEVIPPGTWHIFF